MSQRPDLQEQVDLLRYRVNGLSFMAIALTVAVVFLLSCDAHAAPRVGSYMQQMSDGSPLVVAGRLDSARVAYLATFDDAVLNATPWLQGNDGQPRTDVFVALRRANPAQRLWLYVSMDPWLPQSFRPQPTDRSAYRDLFDAMAAGNGFLYGTDGERWYGNYGLNAADYWTMWRVGDVLTRLVRLGLVDGVFLDNLTQSIGWTDRSGARILDISRAGFATDTQMDSARTVNIALLIRRLHEAGGCGFLVAVNCGPEPAPAGTDVTFREGLGVFTTLNQARAFCRSPGMHWIRGDCWDAASCYAMQVWMKSAALGNPNVVISAGPGTGWPPEGR